MGGEATEASGEGNNTYFTKVHVLVHYMIVNIPLM